MKIKLFKDKKHIALWVGYSAFLLSLTAMLYSLLISLFCQNIFSIPFEPIIVFLVSLGAYLSNENPWEYKKYHFLNSNKKGVSFHLAKNNQKFMIGSNDKLFDLKFSSSGVGSIQIYGIGYGSNNIKGICIIKDIDSVEDITDFDLQNYSSHITAYTGDFILIKNSLGNYAALRILSADSRSHGGEDSVEFDYWIL